LTAQGKLMKILMSKNGVEHYVNEQEQDLLLSAGWQQAGSVKAAEEIIRLKPTVKNKATASALVEANDTTNKGDE